MTNPLSRVFLAISNFFGLWPGRTLTQASPSQPGRLDSDNTSPRRSRMGEGGIPASFLSLASGGCFPARPKANRKIKNCTKRWEHAGPFVLSGDGDNS